MHKAVNRGAEISRITAVNVEEADITQRDCGCCADLHTIQNSLWQRELTQKLMEGQTRTRKHDDQTGIAMPVNGVHLVLYLPRLDDVRTCKKYSNQRGTQREVPEPRNNDILQTLGAFPAAVHTTLNTHVQQKRTDASDSLTPTMIALLTRITIPSCLYAYYRK